MPNLHQNMVIPDLYIRLDIHQYFGIQNLKSDEIECIHGYS